MSRYSQIYVERPPPETDSTRLRKRIAAFIENRFAEFSPYAKVKLAIVALIHEDLGVEIPYRAGMRDVSGFIEAADLRDLLDSITLIHRTIMARVPDPFFPEWRDFIVRALEEENVAYRIDDDGIVHPFVDSEFAANRAAAVAALGNSRFGEARGDFENAHRHLRNGEYKQAIRSMFPAVETSAKVLYPDRFVGFDVAEIRRYLVPRLRTKYAENQPAIDAGQSLLGGFEKWIIASQPYRHGQQIEALTEPPRELAIAHLSSGATFLRWMIELSE